HPVQAHPPAVFGGINLLDSMALQILDFVRRDCPATTHDHPYIGPAALPEHVHHILEILVMAALVGADRDCVGVLLDCGAHDVGYAAVVPQMDHFRPVSLQEAADHVDGGIVAVEQRSCGNEAQRRLGGGLFRSVQGRAALDSGTHVFYAPVG